MPTRTITIGGDAWEVAPAGRTTQYDRDEFSLLFTRRTATGAPAEVRVTRYSPQGALERDASLAQLGAAELERLFAESQPSVRSPEAGYSR